MLLPLSILYYKLHQLDKAEDHLKRLASVNKDTKKFLRIMINRRPDALIDHLDLYGYRPFTIEELIEDLVGNAFLLRLCTALLRMGIQLSEQAHRRQGKEVEEGQARPSDPPQVPCEKCPVSICGKPLNITTIYGIMSKICSREDFAHGKNYVRIL